MSSHVLWLLQPASASNTGTFGIKTRTNLYAPPHTQTQVTCLIFILLYLNVLYISNGSPAAPVLMQIRKKKQLKSLHVILMIKHFSQITRLLLHLLKWCILDENSEGSEFRELCLTSVDKMTSRSASSIQKNQQF